MAAHSFAPRLMDKLIDIDIDFVHLPRFRSRALLAMPVVVMKEFFRGLVPDDLILRAGGRAGDEGHISRNIGVLECSNAAAAAMTARSLLRDEAVRRFWNARIIGARGAILLPFGDPESVCIRRRRRHDAPRTRWQPPRAPKNTPIIINIHYAFRHYHSSNNLLQWCGTIPAFRQLFNLRN